MKLLDKLFKKDLSDDFVELSIGIVRFKHITNGILNNVTTKSTILKGSLNNNLFYQLMEYEVVNLSKSKIDKLTVSDGDKLRAKLKEILLRYGIVKEEKKIEKLEEKEANIFGKADVEWFEQSKINSLKKYAEEVGGVING